MKQLLTLLLLAVAGAALADTLNIPSPPAVSLSPPPIGVGAKILYGTATLDHGTNRVSCSAVGTNASGIFLTYVSLDGSSAGVFVKEVVSHSSFTIRGTSSTDTNAVNWMIIQPQ
jgi:hypothetical protein